MTNFLIFSSLVRDQFDKMSEGELHVTDISTDVLWDTYLSSFPEGTDPMYKERTEHDCNCCKQFIRNIANVVSIKDLAVTTVWDVAVRDAPYPYNKVAQAMFEMVQASNVHTIFHKSESHYGQETSFQQLEDKRVIEWHHFEAKLKPRFVSDNGPTLISEANSNAQVFRRGLDELRLSAVDSVLDLINSNSIYRGEEFTSIVSEFKKLKAAYSKLNSDNARATFVWENLSSFASRFRNTAIGTLVQDLSNDVELESAVRMFESKVAPDNYKRTTSLITPNMIKDAMKTVDDLGIADSLQRRFAILADVSVNDVLFVDNQSRSLMKDSGLTQLLMEEVKTKKMSTDRATKITIEDFLETVLPRTESVELQMKNTMSGNLMSLTAPINEDAPKLFKWNNGFSWSYNGNVADSMKEKVKRAGGNVDAQLRVSLNWFNTDDLDIHVREPDGNTINFSNRSGKLDVDMNVSRPVRDAVENVRWLSTPADGTYTVSVKNYTVRERVDVGFNLEVESDGILYEFSYAKPVHGMVQTIEIDVRDGKVMKIEKLAGVVENSSAKDIWNLKTEMFVKVNTIVTSPNYMEDDGVGNKHWFFVLDQCVNPDATRGFYNEQLRGDLTKHRKVFEILADKLKCEHTTDQMSGVGFSSTKKDAVVVHAKGSTLNQLYEINF
jgi:hypothetical protein